MRREQSRGCGLCHTETRYDTACRVPGTLSPIEGRFRCGLSRVSERGTKASSLFQVWPDERPIQVMQTKFKRACGRHVAREWTSLLLFDE